MNGRVLVLNSTYEPINVCTTRRAIVMILKGIARTEERHAHHYRSSHTHLHVPSVIRLTQYVHIPYERKSLSRKNILLRDHYTCQYCARVLPTAELTLDHVIPKSRGGGSGWDNLVTCCKRCNNRKGNLLLDEAGMRLLKRPQSFSHNVNRQIMRYLGRSDEAWRKYLFYES